MSSISPPAPPVLRDYYRILTGGAAAYRDTLFLHYDGQDYINKGGR